MSGGKNAVRGFEYQFLCTLEYGLDSLLSSDTTLSGISVEPLVTRDSTADQEIVDFAIHDQRGCALAAQVKSGIVGSTMSAVQAVRMLIRLLTHDAERYAVITNRGEGTGMAALRTLLSGYGGGELGTDEVRFQLLSLVASSEEVHRKLRHVVPIWWERLRRTQIVLDSRS